MSWDELFCAKTFAGVSIGLSRPTSLFEAATTGGSAVVAAGMGTEGGNEAGSGIDVDPCGRGGVGVSLGFCCVLERTGTVAASFNGTVAGCSCDEVSEGGVGMTARCCLAGLVGLSGCADTGTDCISEAAACSTSTDGRGISWVDEEAGVCACLSEVCLSVGCFSALGIGGEADGGATGPSLRTGARGLKLAAPFFFKRELIAQ